MRATPDLSTAGGRKSSHSIGDAEECVEVADGFLGTVPVHDSKEPHGQALVSPAGSWSAFTAGCEGSMREHPSP